MWRKTGSYIAVYADDGSRVVITVFQIFKQVRTLDGVAYVLGGTKAHKMLNGNHVNVLDGGMLEDVVTGRKLRRFEPARPSA